jgi:hypothetical protein
MTLTEFCEEKESTFTKEGNESAKYASDIIVERDHQFNLLWHKHGDDPAMKYSEEKEDKLYTQLREKVKDIVVDDFNYVVFWMPNDKPQVILKYCNVIGWNTTGYYGACTVVTKDNKAYHMPLNNHYVATIKEYAEILLRIRRIKKQRRQDVLEYEKQVSEWLTTLPPRKAKATPKSDSIDKKALRKRIKQYVADGNLVVIKDGYVQTCANL